VRLTVASAELLALLPAGRARSTTRASTPSARAGPWDDAHVYVDDGISAAEFTTRPGFLRLMNALTLRAPFRVLVMSEESRLGPEAIETAYALKQIVQAGVRVHVMRRIDEAQAAVVRDVFELYASGLGDRHRPHKSTL
jgi:DNA invertase Pin-like site-specific DNA recombinase